MACLPSNKKCEWIELRGFVEHYNLENQVRFEHAACLDRTIHTSPQPEVLCVDAATGRRMVIESKHLIWPPDDAKHHHAWHRLAEAVASELSGSLSEAPYSLRFAKLDSYSDTRISELANEIASEVRRTAPLLLVGQYCELGTSIGVTLKRQYENERDDPEPSAGLIFEDSDRGSASLVERSVLDLRLPAEFPVKFDEMLNKIYSACDAKFVGYADCTRLLELRTVSGAMAFELGSWWWDQYFQLRPPPSSIDEIWFTYNYDDGHNGWMRERIYRRSARIA